jgi:hypothetical protein
VLIENYGEAIKVGQKWCCWTDAVTILLIIAVFSMAGGEKLRDVYCKALNRLFFTHFEGDKSKCRPVKRKVTNEMLLEGEERYAKTNEIGILCS